MMAERSVDKRLKVGCVITSIDHSQVYSVGYNGNYKGGPNQADSDEPGCSGLIHAEVNAIVKCEASKETPKIVYITHGPCIMCSKLLINMGGVKKVIYETDYRDTSGLDILKSCNIEVIKFSIS